MLLLVRPKVSAGSDLASVTVTVAQGATLTIAAASENAVTLTVMNDNN